MVKKKGKKSMNKAENARFDLTRTCNVVFSLDIIVCSSCVHDLPIVSEFRTSIVVVSCVFDVCPQTKVEWLVYFMKF